MGRTIGTVGRERATGIASMTGGPSDTGPPRTSCSKLKEKSCRVINLIYGLIVLTN